MSLIAFTTKSLCSHACSAITTCRLHYVKQIESQGLIFFGNVILPFMDHFPQDNELYSIMTTKPGEAMKGEPENE